MQHRRLNHHTKQFQTSPIVGVDKYASEDSSRLGSEPLQVCPVRLRFVDRPSDVVVAAFSLFSPHLGHVTIANKEQNAQKGSF